MEKYESKQQRILRPAEQIYQVISRFDNLTPALADKVEEWQATEDTCSFKAKGFTVRLLMAEKVAPKHVKIEGDGVPMDFAFWIQLQPVSENDTRLRLVLQVELNFMMRMMLGSKLQEGLDQIAEGIARAMNAAPQP